MLVHNLDGADHDERERFLREHAEEVYAALTDDFATPLRIDELVYLAAERFPGGGLGRRQRGVVLGVEVARVAQLDDARDAVAPHEHQVVIERPAALDELTVRCEPAGQGIDRDDLHVRIAHALRERTGLGIAVELLEPGAVPRSDGKAVRVVDRRPH